tara:strand:+ start:57 stop:422 length:366 start_codon:yes stop_codon:yes gene_type:complete
MTDKPKRKKLKTKPKIKLDLKKVEALASRGLTSHQIASCLNISPSTYFTNQRESKEFAQSIKDGKAKGIQQISNALFESAKAGNTTSQIFFLKAQAGWKDRVDITSDDEALKPTVINFGER